MIPKPHFSSRECINSRCRGFDLLLFAILAQSVAVMIAVVTSQGNSNNILDFVLTNRPDLIKKLTVDDGVAYHNTILIDINISPKRKCRPKRKFFIRKKSDNASILKHLDNFKDEYFMLNDNTTVNDKWNIVTSEVANIINKYVRHFFTLLRHNLLGSQRT